MKLKKLTYIFLTGISLSLTSTIFSCTRVLHVDPHQGVMVGRNMDWDEEMYSKLVVYPRGIQRQGYAPVNPLKWESKYGSIVATSYDLGGTDGMNEKGLAAHGLWLEESDYGSRNENIPGMSLLMWIQFYLDNFKTVDEAVRYTETGAFQILPFYHPGTQRWVKAHLALEDSSGDSAIIEYINGTPKIYHSSNYTVLTNEPVYHLQLENLKHYDGFGGTKSLPGTNESPDRFVRAAYHGNHLPRFSSTQEAVAGIFSVLQNATPPHAPFEKDPSKIESTIWRTVCDLTHHVYYFNSTPHMTTVYAQLDQFHLEPGSPVMKLDLVKRYTLSGDVTKEFEIVK
jgi:penicillin V acylase-like amidase (Ntn superfamily)